MSNNPPTDEIIQENLELRKQIKEKDHIIDKLNQLIQVNSVISSSLEQNKVLKNLIDQTISLLNCEKCNILMVDFENNQLRYEIVSDDEEMEKLKRLNLELGEDVAGTVWKIGKPLLIDDPRKDSRFLMLSDNITGNMTQSIMSIPLVVNGRILGVMEAINKKDNESFDYFDLDLFQHLSIQAGIAIENAKLYEAGITDGMTKLYIHKYFQERLLELTRSSERYRFHVALVMFDIDHFKKFNDTYGHQIGDEVLKMTAKTLRLSVRLSDIPCRYGGEEFAIILPHTNLKGAKTMAERIRKTIEKTKIEYDRKLINVTISGGVASYRENNCNSTAELIKKADQALYKAKESGRNQILTFSNKEK